jgi:hypothetical protein
MADLIAAIAGEVRKATTQALDISFNELLDMAEGGELNIRPDYQRLFRWSEGQRSRFIESLILEMPVPPIFVIEEDDGKYQLIDGLQRISSYLHLRGALDAPHLDPPVRKGEKLKFVDCDIAEDLNGLTFDDLPSALQIRLKRAFIRVEVIRKGTDPRFRYHMFKRLNTGGAGLSPQQIRNCAVRMLSNEFPDFIVDLSKNVDFQICTDGLTIERILAAVNEELVLRFFALKNNREMFKHDVSDFLTEYMEGVADPAHAGAFNYRDERAVFEKTFALLASALGDKAFAFRNKAGNDLSAGFSIYHFEAISVGLQAVIEKIAVDNLGQIERLGRELKAVKLDEEFVRMTSGGGKNSPGLLAQRIGRVEEVLQNAFP